MAQTKMFKFGLGCTPLNVKAMDSNQLLQLCNKACSPLHTEIRSELAHFAAGLCTIRYIYFNVTHIFKTRTYLQLYIIILHVSHT